MWSLHLFATFSYLLLVTSIVVYLLPVARSFFKNSAVRDKTNFSFLIPSDFMPVFMVVTFLLLLVLLTWSSSTLSAWFGHIVFSSVTFKIIGLVLLVFTLVTLLFCSTSYFSSKEIYDYVIVQFHFLYWVILLFLTNSLFTTIFVIEVLSTLILLLIITSTFSTTFFYNNLDLSFGHVFQNSVPTTYMQSLLYFFWISLISSLNLFLLLIFLFLKLNSLDYYLIEHVFSFFVSSSSPKEIASLWLVSFLLLLCIFLKCGLAPLFLWKLTFFRGLPTLAIAFYVCFFYFFIFLFFIHLITSYLSVLFFCFAWVNLLFVVLGLGLITLVLLESLYVKTFIALSSILNSLLVLMSLAASHTIQMSFWM